MVCPGSQYLQCSVKVARKTLEQHMPCEEAAARPQNLHRGWRTVKLVLGKPWQDVDSLQSISCRIKLQSQLPRLLCVGSLTELEKDRRGTTLCAVAGRQRLMTGLRFLLVGLWRQHSPPGPFAGPLLSLGTWLRKCAGKDGNKCFYKQVADCAVRNSTRCISLSWTAAGATRARTKVICCFNLQKIVSLNAWSKEPAGATFIAFSGAVP